MYFAHFEEISGSFVVIRIYEWIFWKKDSNYVGKYPEFEVIGIYMWICGK